MGYSFDYPIMDCWKAIETISEINCGVILDGYWHRYRKGFYLIIYDLNRKLLVKYLDETVIPHLKIEGKVTDTVSDLPITSTTMYNATTDQEITVSTVPTLDNNIYYNYKLDKSTPILNQSVNFDMTYFHEKQRTPGSIISISSNKISEITSEQSVDIRNKLQEETEEIIELAELNMPLLEMDIPDIDRVAFDIEVKGPKGTFPVPDEAAFPVHGIGLYQSDQESIMWMLGFGPTKTEKQKIIDKLGYLPEIRAFISEKSLLSDFFETIIYYPIVMSYNGDKFDMPYLKNRGTSLGINVPISEGFTRGYYYNKQYHFHGTIHLDLFRFFANNSVRLYAFGAKYSRLRLDDVAEGLLGINKVQHNLWFDKMSRDQMVAYTIRDVELTYKLTSFSNNLTIAVMLMIMRVGKMTMTQVNRASISNWILNWIAFEHARKGWILPSKDILKQKGVFDSTAGIDGKQYQGAIVFEPEAGVYWDVTVADYASLYPSVIKQHRLSYETLRCGHKQCKNNPDYQVPELTHWICRRQGIMSALVGYVRDIRVKHYKPLAKNGKSNDIRILANTIQAALKVFINASYGVFGNKNFALFCPPVAESTTAFSRHALLEAKRVAEKMGYDVVYGDTDSIFVHKLTKDDFAKLSEWSNHELGIELGIDYRFRYLVMSNRKKNYFGIKEDSGTITKGLQVKKSNTSIFIKELFQEILDVLREVKNEIELKEAIDIMKHKIRKTREMIRVGEIPIEKLARMVTLTKDFDEYMTKTPAVQVAVQEINEENEQEFQKGTQFMIVPVKPVKVVVQTTKFSAFPRGYTMECKYSTIENTDVIRINWRKFEQELRRAFTPIFDSFGLNWDEEINLATSLDQYF